MEAASPALNLPSAAKLRPSPAVPGSMESAIKMWLQVGNVQKLQQAVLDGYGWLLKDQTSRLPHVNKFLKKVPDYQEKIDSIHESVIRGNIREVRGHLDKRGWANARDHYGHSPLHKSVMANQQQIMEFVIKLYPDHLEDRDNEGRTPLHYAAALQGTTSGVNQLYSLLTEQGADENVVDVQGHTPAYYRDHPQDVRHRTVQSRKPPPMATRLIKADPDSATSPIPPPNRAYLRSLIHSGDLEHLEKVVLDGHGHKLLHETSALEKVTKFIYALPDFMDTISILHNATMAGVVPVVSELLTSERLALSRDKYGATPLHKAVLFYQPKLVKLIADKYRITTRAKDQEGRTPLHYSAALHDSGIFYRYLLKCGADENIQDKYGKTAKFYVYAPGEIDLNVLISRCKEMPRKTQPEGRPKMHDINTEQKLRNEAFLHSNPPKALENDLVREMIMKADLEALESVVLDGHGGSLLEEPASSNKVRAFIRSVPNYLKRIEKIHEAVVEGSLETLEFLLKRKKLAISKDHNGLGLLHKAVYHGHRDIAEWLLEKFPATKELKDWDGRTALHYSCANANAMRLGSMLASKGLDATVIDNFGHDLHYYSERPMDVQQPEWHPQWENYIPEHERSPTPGREPITRKSIRDKKSAIQKSIMQARGRKNSHKPSMQGGSSAILKRDQTGNIDGKQDTAPQQNQTTKYKQSSQQSKLISVDKSKQTADGHARPRKLSPIKNVQMNKYKTSLTWFAKRM